MAAVSAATWCIVKEGEFTQLALPGDSRGADRRGRNLLYLAICILHKNAAA